MKCDDLKEGFARVRCPDCHTEFFIAFSCRQRACCPSCDQKRALLLAHRLNSEVFAQVSHRQWVFTIPKRLRNFFHFDRSLLGKLCHAVWETVRELYALEVDGICGIPAMIGAIQANDHAVMQRLVEYISRCPLVTQYIPDKGERQTVYEVDALKCPKSVVSHFEPCGGTMIVRPGSPTKIISFIEDDATIQKILKHWANGKSRFPDRHLK